MFAYELVPKGYPRMPKKLKESEGSKTKCYTKCNSISRVSSHKILRVMTNKTFKFNEHSNKVYT